MIDPQALYEALGRIAAPGVNLNECAKQLVALHRDLDLASLAKTLRRGLGENIIVLTVQSAVAGNAEFNDALNMAVALKAGLPDTTPGDMASTLHNAGMYPDLSATQMAEILKSPGVYPDINATDMRTALSAGGYEPGDIDSAIAQCYPAAPSYRRLGPAGKAGRPVFDDSEAAQSLQQALTQIVVNHGDIVDAIQAFYGDAKTALPKHGGSGGGATTVVLNAGDAIVEIAGYSGSWFGGNYILQLTLRTRLGTVYGPFGTMNYSAGKQPFCLTANANEKVISFFGSSAPGNNGKSIFLGSLGVVAQS